MASMGRYLCASKYHRCVREANPCDVFDGKGRVRRRSQGMISCELGKVGSLYRMASTRSKCRRDIVMHSSASDAIITVENTEKRVQLSDVIDWFINLPWPKMASWILVIGVASQLKEFLGVRMMTLKSTVFAS